jgi:hypothetical protein
MSSRSSTGIHRDADDGSKNDMKRVFTFSKIATDKLKLNDIDTSDQCDENRGIEINTKIADYDESVVAYSLPNIMSIASRDQQHPDILNYVTEELRPYNYHPYDLHNEAFFSSLDGVEVDSNISMSWHREGSSLLGSSINDSFSRMEDDHRGGDYNRETLGLESSADGCVMDKDQRRCFCLPPYLRDAPVWIRSIVFTSVFLFIASFILVLGTVSVRLIRDNVASTPYARNIPDRSFPTPSPSSSTISKGQRIFSSLAPTYYTMNRRKTMAPSLIKRITIKPSSSSFLTPSSFWVVSQQFNNVANMTALLKSLPFTDSTALFHLGNWNDPVSCNSDAYLKVATKYEGSFVPVIFVPGQHETNSCPNPEVALSNWRQYLINISQANQNTSPPSLIIYRDPSRTENFSAVRFGILYVGVNVVGGNVINQTAWTSRLTQDLNWIDDNISRFKSSVRVIVILGNSGPSMNNTNNDAFFMGLKSLVIKYNSDVIDAQVGKVRTLPFVYIHDSSSTWGVAQKFMGVSRFIRVNVEGNKWPPMRVSVNPLNYTIMFDQSNWTYSS